MAQQFPGEPGNIYEYENRFNYSVWTPNTTVCLCNVPWDSSYRDVVRFEDDKARDEWFASRAADGYAFTLNGLVYLRYGEPVRVNAPFDMVTRCNYMVVRNNAQPVPGASSPDVFYYFVTDAKYIAPNTTQINVQLDVWQTYYNRVRFDMCYVNKGHIGIANENSTRHNLSDYLTDTEGLNIGDEYETVKIAFNNFMQEPPYVIIVSTASLTGDFGTISDPVLSTATGDVNDGLPSGCNVYAVDGQNFQAVMSSLANTPWVSQCITMITVVPRVMCQIEGDPVRICGGVVEAYKLADNPSDDVWTFTFDGLWESFNYPHRYRNLLKFYTAPYSVIEVTAFNGGELVLKPECIETRDELKFATRSICAPPDIRAYMYPVDYNGSGTAFTLDYYAPTGFKTSTTVESGEFLDMALMYSNFPQLSLVNNSYMLYMASTAHTRAYQFASADWSQQKSLTAAQLSFNQSGANMQNAWANQQVANNANWALSQISQEKNSWNTMTSILTDSVGAVGGMLKGNAGEAVSSIANIANAGATGLMNQDWINRTTSTQVGAATQTAQNNIGLQTYMRDTNYDYAVYAANGDYETAIQGIQAKVQDAKLTQPSTSGQNGGDAFNIANGYMGVCVKWKRLKGNFMRQIGDFWLRYGYYVNRWITPPEDLRCMENFTYWKMQSTALSTTEVPEIFKETIRGIFEKGVTVWHNPDKMYKIDLDDNEPVKGVAY